MLEASEPPAALPWLTPHYVLMRVSQISVVPATHYRHTRQAPALTLVLGVGGGGEGGLGPGHAAVSSPGRGQLPWSRVSKSQIRMVTGCGVGQFRRKIGGFVNSIKENQKEGETISGNL